MIKELTTFMSAVKLLSPPSHAKLRRIMFGIVPVVLGIQSASAQPLLTQAANMPRNGDSLAIFTIKNIPKCSYNGICDLSEACASKRSAAIYSNSGDTVSSIILGTRSRYLLHGDTLLLAGYENRHMRVEYGIPLPILKWPISPHDSVGGTFEGNAVWCDKLHAKVNGRAWTVADTPEYLILPSGDTLRNVVRLRHFREIYHITYDNISTWDSLCSTKILVEAPFKHTLPVRAETTAWFAVGWRYPLLVVESTEDAGKHHVSAFLCTPNEQDALDYDFDNAMLRDFKQNRRPNDVIKKDGIQGLMIKSLRYDSQAALLSVSCEAASDTELTLCLSDAAGIVWRNMSAPAHAGGTTDFQVDCSGLRHGQYALSIAIGTERQSYKFNIK